MASDHRARGRLPGRPLLVLLVALLLLSPLGEAGARRVLQVGKSDSPAIGRSQVATQGIADLPEGRIVYRVVRRTAPARGDAKVGRRVLSIVLATDDPVLLSNERADGTIEDVARVAPGESYLVQAGTRQIRSGLDDQPVDYLAVEIVQEDSGDDIGNGELLFLSDPFLAPDGPRDIDFVRNVLEGNDTGLVPDSGNTVAILATDGAIDILPANGRTTTLQAGESAIFPAGDLEIEAATPTVNGVPTNQLAGLTSSLQTGASDAAYVVTVIGDEVPATDSFPTATSLPDTGDPNPNPNPPVDPQPRTDPTPPATPAPDGEIDVAALLCPYAPVPGEPLETSTCGAAGTFGLTLSGPGVSRTLSDAVVDQSGFAYVFGNLPLGSYAVTVDTLPAGAVGYAVVTPSANVVGSASTGYTATLDDEFPQAVVPIVFFTSATTAPTPTTVPVGVTVNLTLSECDGYDAATGPTGCQPVGAGASTQPYLQRTDTGQVTDASLATTSGNLYTWVLPVGGYLVQITQPFDMVVNGSYLAAGNPYGIVLTELPFNLDVYAIRPPVIV